MRCYHCLHLKVMRKRVDLPIACSQDQHISSQAHIDDRQLRLRIVLSHCFSRIEVYFQNGSIFSAHESPPFSCTERAHPIFFSIDIYDCSIFYISDRLRDDPSLGSDEYEVNLSTIRNPFRPNKPILKIHDVAIECKAELRDQLVLPQHHKLGVECHAHIDGLRFFVECEADGLNWFWRHIQDIDLLDG